MDRKSFFTSVALHIAFFIFVICVSLYTPRSQHRVVKTASLRGVLQQSKKNSQKQVSQSQIQNSENLQRQEDTKQAVKQEQQASKEKATPQKQKAEHQPNTQQMTKEKKILESKKKNAAIEKKTKKVENSSALVKQEKADQNKVEDALKELEKAEAKQNAQAVDSFLMELANEKEVVSSGTGKEIASYEEYTEIVGNVLRSQWFFPKLGQTENLLTVMRIYVDGTGRIVRYSIEQKSGRDDFDSAAIKAVSQFTHFPPPPEGKEVNFVVNFNLLEE